MIDKLLQYQTIDAELKAIENTLRQSEEFKKYASAVKFLKTVAESKAQIESKAGALMGAMANLEEQLNKLNEEKAKEAAAENAGVDPELLAYINERIEARKNAKKNKNFAEADAIRDELLAKGITLLDTREGTKFSLS